MSTIEENNKEIINEVRKLKECKNKIVIKKINYGNNNQQINQTWF